MEDGQGGDEDHDEGVGPSNEEVAGGEDEEVAGGEGEEGGADSDDEGSTGTYVTAPMVAQSAEQLLRVDVPRSNANSQSATPMTSILRSGSKARARQSDGEVPKLFGRIEARAKTWRQNAKDSVQKQVARVGSRRGPRSNNKGKEPSHRDERTDGRRHPLAAKVVRFESGLECQSDRESQG